MHYAGYELLYLFLFYSFIGWVIETVFAAIRERRFVNRGLINGPFCITYGIASVVITVGLRELSGIWLFIGAMILATVVEWIAGHLIEKIFKERWWDYSALHWNLDGYICLAASVLWGLLGFVMATWLNPLLLLVYHFLPFGLMYILSMVIFGILLLDVLASHILARGKSGRLKRWEAANNRFDRISARLGQWIYAHVERRIHRAYPKAKPATAEVRDKTVFAQGCGFYKIVLLFFIGAFLGDITETVFCRFTMGYWMSRSSVIWGPFSIVWGLAIAAVTALLYKYRKRSEPFLFWMGTFLGGAYEYLCSVFTEIVFGKVFWDYSGIPFNLGGRINLLYCFFWGFAAIVWFKHLYPHISNLIERIPRIAGKIVTWVLILFMCANVVVTSMALIRYDERGRGVSAEASWQEWMDAHYDDAFMEHRYPNAKPAQKGVIEEKVKEVKST